MNTTRGTYVMLGIVGLVAGLVALGGWGGPLIGALVVGGFIALMAATLATNRLSRLREAIPQIATTARATQNARAATARARRVGGSYMPEEVVTDIGLIVNNRDRAGKLTRRLAQTVSMDEAAMQPLVKFVAPPERQQRVALVKFDILDKAGKVRFSRQVEHFVRDGENLVACDQQLPLKGNAGLGRAGIWDLQVTVNGQLAAIHSFTVTPAQQDLPPLSVQDGEIERLRVPEDEQDMPMTLEDLLRESRDEAASGRQGT